MSLSMLHNSGTGLYCQVVYSMKEWVDLWTVSRFLDITKQAQHSGEHAKLRVQIVTTLDSNTALTYVMYRCAVS